MKNYFFLMILGSLIFWAGCKKDSNSTETKANFTFQITGNPGEVSFTNKSENAQTYQWDFGDGKASTKISTVHVYDLNDTYYVKLTAYGNQKTASFQDTVFITNILKK